MKHLILLGPIIGIGLLASCSTPAETLTVDCGDRMVTLEEGTITALRSNIAGDNAALAVAACELASQVPAPAAGTTIPATVTSQSGSQFTVQVAGK